MDESGNDDFQRFKKFLHDVNVTKIDTVNALWLSDIRSAAEIATAEQSRLRTLTQDRVLTEVIYPELNKINLKICMAGKDGNAKAIQLLRKMADHTIQSDATGVDVSPLNGNVGQDVFGEMPAWTPPTINISGGDFSQTNVGGQATFDNRGATITMNTKQYGGKDLNDETEWIKTSDGSYIQSNFRFFDNSDFSWNGEFAFKRKVFNGGVSSYEAYPMKASKNRALLINNYEFQDPRLNRAGAIKDGVDLQNALKKLGFEAELIVNKKASEIEQSLREFACSTKNTKASAVFIFIGSHGEIKHGEDFFLGQDLNQVSVKSVLDVLSQNNCELLKNKPKCFMFQFCRAVTKQSNVASDAQPILDMEVDDKHDDDNSSTIGPQFITRMSIESDTTAIPEDQNHVQTPTTPPTPQTPNNMAPEQRNHPAFHYRDMIMAFCTSPGTKAYRDCTKGSWYVTAFIKVLTKDVHKEDLASILTKVNQQVQSKEHTTGTEIYVQLCEVRSFLQKKLVFLPISD